MGDSQERGRSQLLSVGAERTIRTLIPRVAECFPPAANSTREQLFKPSSRKQDMHNEAEVVGIGAGTDPNGGNPIPAIILEARGEYLPIFVTGDQAESIRLALADEPFERPLTHDLLVELLTEFGGAIDAVRIDDLSEGTFFAKLDIERYDDGRPEKFVFDTRPSDAIALAVRIECPITIADEVLDEAAQPPDMMDFEGQERESATEISDESDPDDEFR